MLRMVGKKTEVSPAEEEAPVIEEPTEEAPVDPEADAEDAIVAALGQKAESALKSRASRVDESKKVQPERAGYLGGENGPFECQACYHFADGRCDIVLGEIDPKGICNLFTPLEQETAEEPTVTVEEMPPVEEEENGDVPEV